MDLRYRAFVDVDNLALNECTIHHATSTNGARYWNLWWYVARETDGQPEAFCVPVIPNGAFTESGPGGRSWGLNPSDPGAGAWQISPSINVLASREMHPGPHPDAASLWHQTPAIVGVPAGEVWTSPGATP